jgi:hypothetical protein
MLLRPHRILSPVRHSSRDRSPDITRNAARWQLLDPGYRSGSVGSVIRHLRDFVWPMLVDSHQRLIEHSVKAAIWGNGFSRRLGKVRWLHIAELTHRIRNALAGAIAPAQSTAARSSSPETQTTPNKVSEALSVLRLASLTR